MSPKQGIPHKILECLKFILIVEFWLIVMFGKCVNLSERLDFCPHTVTLTASFQYQPQEHGQISTVMRKLEERCFGYLV